MFIATLIAIAFGLLIVVMTAITITSKKTILKVLAASIGIVATIIMAIVFHSWLFLLWAGLLALMVFLVTIAIIKKKAAFIIIAIIATLAAIVVGVLSTRKIIQARLDDGFGGPAVSGDSICQPAQNLELTTDGMVVNNIDDGDNSMGTIIMLTRDTPTKEPVVFVIPAGSSIDIEYKGDMYFTTDRFSGTLAEGACLAEQLHKSVDNKIVVVAGSEEVPTGWKALDKVDGWWSSSTWLYKEANIEPAGLTASQGIFVSVDQKNRDLIAKEGEVIYGQFWQPPYDGIVTHVQIRFNQESKVPEGYEGTYWTWTGDFKIGETDLQKRMLQATFKEVVDRDKIKSVTLFACGTLPTELDKSVYTLYTGESQFGDVTWISSLDGWECKSK